MGRPPTLDEWDPKRGRAGRPYEELKKMIYAREVCWICGGSVRYDLGPRHPLAPSVDHLVPLSLGGHPLDPQNAELAHYGCNSRRGNGTRQRYAAEKRPRSRDY